MWWISPPFICDTINKNQKSCRHVQASQGGGFKRYLGLRISCDGFPLILSDVKMSSLKPTCLETPSLPKMGGEHSYLKKNQNLSDSISWTPNNALWFSIFLLFESLIEFYWMHHKSLPDKTNSKHFLKIFIISLLQSLKQCSYSFIF